jgi:hypothetical protein
MSGKNKIQIFVLGFLLLLVILIMFFAVPKDDDSQDGAEVGVSVSLEFGNPTLALLTENKWQLKNVWKTPTDKVQLTAYSLIFKNGDIRDITDDFIIIQDNVCDVDLLRLKVPRESSVEEIDLRITVPNPCKVATKIDVNDKIAPFLNNPLQSSFSFIQLQNWKFNLACENDTTRYNSFQIRLNLQIQHEIGKSFQVDTNTIDHENKIVTLKCI